MAQVEYYEFGREIYVSVDSEKVSYAGLIINIRGKIDYTFGSSTGIGAVSDMYEICLDPGQVVMLDLQKTTSANNSQLKIGTFNYSSSADEEDNAEKAAGVKNGNGLTTIVAADGKTYQLLVNNSNVSRSFYVSVSMVRKSYEFGLSDIDDIVDLVEEVDDLYEDDWEDRLEETLDENIDSKRDMIEVLKEEFVEVKDVVADAEDILGSNPLLTYQLDIINFVDDEAPVMSSNVSSELHGDDLKLTWGNASDNFFVSGYNVKIYNSNNTLVAQGSTSLKTFFVNDLALGEYTAVVSARDYSGNVSEGVTQKITVDGTAPGFKRGASGNLSANAEVVLDTFAITKESIYRWQDVQFFPASSATLTVKLYNSKGKNVATATYKNGVLSVKKDFKLTADTYTVKASSTVAGSYSVALSELSIVATANNSISEATAICLDSNNSATVAGSVGFGDACDYYKLSLPGAGLLTFTPELMDNKLILAVYNTAGKKIKSVTTTASKMNGLSKVLIAENAAYIAVSSADKGKGGYNNDYSAAVSFIKFKDSEYDSMAATCGSLGLGANEVDNWIGYGDQCDYYTLNLTSPGWYTLDTAAKLDASCRITVYMKTATGYKKLKSGSGVNPKVELLLDPVNTYVVEIQAPKAAKGEQSDYTIRINGIEFTNANKYSDSQAAVLNKTSNAPILNVATSAVKLIDDEWVGYGDEWDYRELNIGCSGSYTFDFNTDGASELGIYQAVSSKNGSIKFKKVKSIKNNSAAQKTVSLKKLILTSGTYYIGVRSTKAQKSAGANYSVSLNAATEFFVKCDNGVNNLYSTTTDVITTSGTGTGWVGFGDAVDVFKVKSDGAGVYNFNVNNVSNNLKVTVFEVVGGKEKKVASWTVKSGKVLNGTAALGTGTYFVKVEATGAKSGKNSDYNLAMNNVAEFNLADNSMAAARDAVAGNVWEGAVYKKIDQADWFDVSEVDRISLDAKSGSFKAVFYDANGQKVKVDSVMDAQDALMKATNSVSMTSGNSKSDNIYIADVDDSFCYLAIEGTGKIGTYVIAFS